MMASAWWKAVGVDAVARPRAELVSHRRVRQVDEHDVDDLAPPPQAGAGAGSVESASPRRRSPAGAAVVGRASCRRGSAGAAAGGEGRRPSRLTTRLSR